MKNRKRFGVLFLAILICISSGAILQAQTNEIDVLEIPGTIVQQFDTPRENLDLDSEYDDWRGSSLGVRIRVKEDGYRITKVLPHVKDSPFEEGDQVLVIGPVDLSKSLLGKIGEFLKETSPGTKVTCKVKRNDEEKTLSVKTYRQEFVDIATLVERIKSNRIIKKHLEDIDRLDELETLTDRMIEAVQSSDSPRLAYEGINQIIDELEISHSAFVPDSTYRQLRGGDVGELGLALRRYNVDGQEGYFIVDIKPGTPAYDSDLRLGDRLLFINGVLIERSRRLVLAGEEQRYEIFAVDADIDEVVRFEFQHRPGTGFQTTRLTAGKGVSLADSINASARVIESDGKQFGYLRFWNLMSNSANSAFRNQLKEQFADCDAIIMDLRGRGGTLPTVLSVDRTVKALDKPVVAITDELSRSAKEILAHRLKKHDNVTIIGEKTSGAVTACMFYRLPSGNVFMHPVMSGDSLKKYTDDVILEGNGVEPDISFEFFEAYCDGVDRLIDFAVKTAVEKTRELGVAEK